MAYNKAPDTRKQASTRTRTSSTNGKLGKRTRESPPDTISVNSLRQNQRVRHALRTVAVVKHQGEWWWTRGPPQVAKHRGLKRLRNTASRTRDDQLIVHRQGRAPDNTCVFDFKGGTPLAGAHLTRPKSRNGHSKPRQRDSLPYASRKGLYAPQINAARRQHSRHCNPTLTRTRHQAAPAQHPPEPQKPR
jgi:hypothetical protein